MTAFREELPGMTAAVVRVHFPNRGWGLFMQSCGLEPLGIPNGTLTQQYVDEVLYEYVKASDTPHLMPTQTQLRAVARDATHPMQRSAGGLHVSISREC